MLKTIIIIIIALFLLMLFWKLMKNFIKALIIVTLLLILFSGIIFIRDYNLIRSVTSSNRLVVLEDDLNPIIGIQNKQTTINFKTPYIAMDIKKIDFKYTGDELVVMLTSSDQDKIDEAIDVINSALKENLMFYLDKKVISIRPEPYFMSMLKGTFRDRIKDDINLVGSAIKTKVSDTRNNTNFSLN
jgi:hypothetical protein